MADEEEREPRSEGRTGGSGGTLTPMPDAGAPSSRERATRNDATARRVFRITGSIALGAFLTEHLVVHGSALGGSSTYDAVAGTLARSPVAAAAELVLVALPLTAHALTGLHLLRSEPANAAEVAGYGDRRRLLAQRLGGAVVALFVVFHLWDVRFQRLFFGLPAEALHTRLAARLSSTWLGIPWLALFHLLGIAASVFYVANGLLATAARWERAKPEAARRRLRATVIALAVALFTLGAATVVGLATGSRLLPGADGDSAPRAIPCGTDVPVSAGEVPPGPSSSLPLPAGRTRP